MQVHVDVSREIMSEII